MVEVDRFSLDEIMSQLTELLESYQHYHFRASDMDPEEEGHFKERADLARDTFRSMFRDQPWDEFLQQSPEAVLDIFRSWVEGNIATATDGLQVRSSLEDCILLLMQLTTDHSSEQEPAVWPYLRKIRYAAQLSRIQSNKGFLTSVGYSQMLRFFGEDSFLSIFQVKDFPRLLS